MGSYKYLMIYFSIFSIFFSCVDVTLKPYFLTTGSTYVVLMNLRQSFLSKSAAYFLLNILCGCFSMTLSIIAVHFVFRYFAIERRGRIKYFEKWYLLGWLSIPIFFGTIWFFTVYCLLPPTAQTSKSLELALYENYGMNVSDTLYVGSHWYTDLGNGTKIMNQDHLLPMSIMGTLIATSVIVVAIFGTRSYLKIRVLLQQGESLYTKNLQKQLYKALVFQTCIPMIFMYIPVSIFLFLGVMDVDFNVQIAGHIATILYAMYPAIDPIPIILIIDNYRRAIPCLPNCGTKIDEEPSRNASLS